MTEALIKSRKPELRIITGVTNRRAIPALSSRKVCLMLLFQKTGVNVTVNVKMNMIMLTGIQ